MDAEYKEIYITEFISRYNSKSRIIDNFRGILNAINEIGLDSKEYTA